MEDEVFNELLTGAKEAVEMHKEILDSELLDALDKAGGGIALLHDDVGHWFVVGDGMQSVPEISPEPFGTTYIVDETQMPLAGKTVREAIVKWLESEDG